ncbi:hypothetical protein BH10PSE17_BH10PSE17_24990 [soil metagenome]
MTGIDPEDFESQWDGTLELVQLLGKRRERFHVEVLVRLGNLDVAKIRVMADDSGAIREYQTTSLDWVDTFHDDLNAGVFEPKVH